MVNFFLDEIFCSESFLLVVFCSDSLLLVVLFGNNLTFFLHFFNGVLQVEVFYKLCFFRNFNYLCFFSESLLIFVFFLNVFS